MVAARSPQLERSFARALVIDDVAATRRALSHALARRCKAVDSAADVQTAVQRLRGARYELIVLDVCLVDGSAFDLLDVIERLEPQPVVVTISGAASPSQSFLLAQRGVRSHLEKPVGVAALDAAIDAAVHGKVDLRPLLRAAVGNRPIHVVEDEVRTIMVREALARARGSRSGAARLLSVSRQLLQHMLRALPLASGEPSSP